MREGVERKIDREGEKGEKEVRGGGGVLMLVLWDWGEGHKKLTAFLKRGILSGLPSVSLRRPSPSTRLFTPREGSVLWGLW